MLFLMRVFFLFLPTPASGPSAPLAPGPPAPSAPNRPVTRLQRGIQQPKQRTDGTVAWTAVCMAHATERSLAEPRDLRDALQTAR
jgi:hypothetical protein